MRSRPGWEGSLIYSARRSSTRRYISSVCARDANDMPGSMAEAVPAARIYGPAKLARLARIKRRLDPANLRSTCATCHARRSAEVSHG